MPNFPDHYIHTKEHPASDCPICQEEGWVPSDNVKLRHCIECGKPMGQKTDAGWQWCKGSGQTCPSCWDKKPFKLR